MPSKPSSSRPPSPANVGEAAPVPSAARPHLGYLDSLRALLAIYVVLHHMNLHMRLDEVVLGSGLQQKFVQLFWFGHFAVNFFIVLSGFCLMLPVVRGSGEVRGGWRAFFVRRAWRILPPYYASLALSLALILFFIGQPTGRPWDTALQVTPATVLTHLLVVHDLFNSHAYTLNYPCWSIAVEWHIYFAFPLLLWLWKRLGITGAALLAVLASAMVSALLDRFWFWQTNLSLHYVGLFALGMGAAGAAFGENSRVYGLARRVPWALVTPFATVLTGAGVYAIHLMMRHSFNSVMFMDILVGVWAALLLLHVSLRERGLLRRVLNWKPLVFAGSFSYSLYLVHAPLLQLVWQYGTSRLHLAPFNEFLLLCFGGTPLIMLAAYGFFLVAEKPFLNRKIRGASHQSAAETAPAG